MTTMLLRTFALALCLSQAASQFSGTPDAEDLGKRFDVAVWEQLLLPTPNITKTLARIVLVTDMHRSAVSLADVPPIGGWQRVLHPGSLRASLHQVQAESWGFLRTSQGHMDHIAVTMSLVPDHVNFVFRVLGFPEARLPSPVMLRLIQRRLDLISGAGTKSAELAAQMNSTIVGVLQLTEELNGAVHHKEGVNKAEAEKTAKLIAMRRAEARFAGERLAAEKEYSKMLQDRIVNQTAAYRHAINNVPTGMDAALQTVVRAFGDVLTGFGEMLGGSDDDEDDENEPSESAEADKAERAEAKKTRESDIILLRHFSAFLKVFAVADIEEHVKQAQAALTEQQKKSLIGYFVTLKETVKYVVDGHTLGSRASPTKDTAIRTYEGLQRLADRMGAILEAKTAPGGSAATDLATVKLGVGELLTLFAAVPVGGTGGDDNGQAAEAAAQAAFMVEGGDYAGANEIALVNMEAHILLYNYAEAERGHKRVMDENKILAGIEVELAGLSVDRLRLKDVQILLRQVYKLLLILERHWSSLAVYFNKLAITTGAFSTGVVQTFVKDTADATFSRSFAVTLLRPNAEKLMRGAHLIESATRTYARISREQIFGRLSESIPNLEPGDTAGKEAAEEALDKAAKEAVTFIRTTMESVRDNYEAELKAKSCKLAATIAAHPPTFGITQPPVPADCL